MTLKEAEGDSSLVKQIKPAIDLKEWYQDDDIQKLMKIGTLLDPRFNKIPYLTEVERTAIWLQARGELVAIIKADQDRQESQKLRDLNLLIIILILEALTLLHLHSLKIGNLQGTL